MLYIHVHVTGFSRFANVKYNPTMALVDRLRDVVFIDDSGAVEEPVLIRTCACDWRQCTFAAQDGVILQPQQRHFKDMKDSDLSSSTLCCPHAPRLCLPAGTHLHYEVVEVSVPSVHEYYTRKAAEILARDLKSSARHVDLFVHLGVHGGARAVHVEEYAYNLADFRVPDERQLQPRNMPICGEYLAAREPCTHEPALLPAYLPALSIALTNALAHSGTGADALPRAVHTATNAVTGTAHTEGGNSGVGVAARGVSGEGKTSRADVALVGVGPCARAGEEPEGAAGAAGGVPTCAPQCMQQRHEAGQDLLAALGRVVEGSWLQKDAALHTGLRVRAVLQGHGVKVRNHHGEHHGEAESAETPLPLAACVGAVATNDPGAFLCNYAFFLALHWTRVVAPRLAPLVARARHLRHLQLAGARVEVPQAQGQPSVCPCGGVAAAPQPVLRGTGLFVHVPPFAVVPEHAQLHTVARVLAACVADMRTQAQTNTTQAETDAAAEAECKQSCPPPPSPLAAQDPPLLRACGADDGASGACACTWLYTRRRTCVDTSDVAPPQR